MPTRPTIVKDDKTAMIIGFEGFVGQHLFRMLEVHTAYKQLIIICQKKPKEGAKHVKWKIASIPDLDFSDKEVDDLFICYDASFFNAGGKYAIPKENYKYFPRLVINAYKNGVSQVMLLSSSTANTEGLLFNQRIRGLIEASVRKMGFWGAHVFRPSLLIGESTGEKWGQKMADEIGNRFDRYTGGWLRKNKPIEASIVARAMLEKAQLTESGIHTYSSAWLQDYASTVKNTEVSKK